MKELLYSHKTWNHAPIRYNLRQLGPGDRLYNMKHCLHCGILKYQNCDQQFDGSDRIGPSR